MFTGIVQAVGRVVALEPRGGDATLRLELPGIPSERLGLGASIAVNGVCLTVVGSGAGAVSFDVSRETLALTTLGDLVGGSKVNFEPALTLADPLGGHLVSGHVDGIGEVVSIEPDARSTRMAFAVPPALLRYVAKKGSLCVDGVSLTINDIETGRAMVNLVPHTLQATIMGGYRVGSRVNLEVDLIARYLERLIESREP